MPPSVDRVRDFVLQMEKTIAARRLYHPSNAAYRDANERLLEKCHAAADGDAFTLTLGAADLFFGKISVLNRPKLEESFFFPLYRDGLRELTFSGNVTADELHRFVSVLEIKERDTGTDDIVSHLWRADLNGITHNAIDGIGDTESDGSDGESSELHALINDLAEKIRNPALPETGQKYAFVLDADVRVATQDFHYDATSLRRTFDENPAVLRLSEEQTAQIRAELNEDRDEMLVERFIEILLLIARSPSKTVEAATIAPVFQQIAEAYWAARDYPRVAAILAHVHATAADAPTPEYRARLADVVRHFVSPERLNILLLDFIGGALDPKIAFRFWDFVPDDVIWPILLDAWSRLPEGETRNVVLAALRRRLAANLDLFRQTLNSPEPSRVRAALAMIDERTEQIFANDLVCLSSHADESIRLRGLATASRVGGPLALEALWRAMEFDPSQAARLYAFRAMSGVRWPELAPRLQALVEDGQFSERPMWEREKYVRLLATIAGPAVEPLFESWIPAKRWLWPAEDLQMLELALRGIAWTGPQGEQKVRAMAERSGKPAEVARRVLETMGGSDPGDNTVRQQPPTTNA